MKIERMRKFLSKMIVIVTETEKMHSRNQTKVKDFNALLYEYERIQMETFCPIIDSS